MQNSISVFRRIHCFVIQVLIIQQTSLISCLPSISLHPAAPSKTICFPDGHKHRQVKWLFSISGVTPLDVLEGKTGCSQSAPLTSLYWQVRFFLGTGPVFFFGMECIPIDETSSIDHKQFPIWDRGEHISVQHPNTAAAATTQTTAPLCQIYGQPDISLDLWGSSSSQTDAVTQTLIFFFDCSTIYEATSRYYSQPLTILQSSFLTIELILKLIIPFSWVFVLTAFKNVVVKPILKSTVLDALDLNNWHFSQCWMWTSAWPLTQT